MVKKIMAYDPKIGLQDAVNMGSWTYNTNVIVSGFTPKQLITGKNVILLGTTQGNMATKSLYEEEGVRNIMERHN